MGSITERRRKDGSIAYMAQVALMRDGKFVHRETKSFDRRPAANAWIKKREAELAKPGGLDLARSDKRSPTLGDAIARYVAESKRQLGRTKEQVLATLKSLDIAERPCAEITSADLVELARWLGETRKPQTVGNYLSHLGAIFAIARPAWGYPLNEQTMADAFKVSRRLGYTAKSTERDRRPTLSELEALMTHFADRSIRRTGSAPMHVICAFAIFSTRRLDEITRIAWADLDEPGRRVKVRDMKNPGEKIGNDVWCDLTPEAISLIQAQPRGGDEIFPYGPDAISAAFTRACKLLGIEDLHFHDLRHEGVSRLFEMGWNIPHVAAVSGHRSWASLKRYTHLRQSGDKYEGWPWLGKTTAADGDGSQGGSK
jgi:integrase